MNMDTQHGHGLEPWIWTCNIDMHHGHGTWTWTWKCTLTCTMHMRPDLSVDPSGHLTRAVATPHIVFICFTTYLCILSCNTCTTCCSLVSYHTTQCITTYHILYSYHSLILLMDTLATSNLILNLP
jgi:hypothetical protein